MGRVYTRDELIVEVAAAFVMRAAGRELDHQDEGAMGDAESASRAPSEGSSGRVTLAYSRGVEAFDRIERDPAVMTGRPCIRGTRVTVGAILGQLAAGHSVAHVVAAYPYLTESDVQAALSYAAWRTDEFEFPIPAA